MKNVVVTGVGIVSCIGSDTQEVLNSLKKGKSGISRNSTYADMGFRSHVSGAINLDLAELIDRKTLRFMSEACLLYTSPSPRDRTRSRMPSSA